MPFQIVRNDITKVKADVIVNTANPEPIVGGGTDSAIYEAAGKEMLLSERKKIGNIMCGDVAVTRAFHLDAKYIFHTVGPMWSDGKHGEIEALTKCYQKSLEKAIELKCESIAFPLISTGVYGFPHSRALQIAMSTIQKFLMEYDLNVTLVIFGDEAYDLSLKVYNDIISYVDKYYIQEAKAREYDNYYGNRDLQQLKKLERMGVSHSDPLYQSLLKRVNREKEASVSANSSGSFVSINDIDFDKLVPTNEKTFQEKLFELIWKSGMEEYDAYLPLGYSRAFFSKLRSNKDYQPTKNTVLGLAITVKLEYDELVDLLGRAGFGLNRSDMKDIIIEACVKNHYYNLDEIDRILEDYGVTKLKK